MAKVYSQERIAQMLASARAKVASDQPQLAAAVAAIQGEQNSGTVIDLSLTGLDLDSPEAVEAFLELVEGINETGAEEQPAVGESSTPTKTGKSKLGVARDDIIYNEAQQRFIDQAVAGHDLVLVGKAGTGKTTCQRGLGKALVAAGKVKPLSRGTKWLQSGVPGVIVVSFTNKAVNNIRHALIDEIKPHALTIHKVLEFAPVFYEIENDEKPGEMKKTMRFEPTRTRFNPLPSELKLIVHEETSMEGVDLYELLMDACPHKPQQVFLGDIQQLPPVFGSSILGFKMIELPIIELTEVHRQAANSPILSLAYKILDGSPVPFNSKPRTFEMYSEHAKKKVKRIAIPALEKLSYENEDGQVVFQPWQKQLSADNALNTCVKQFCDWADKGYYDANDDILLCPFNVSFGTVEINRGIAQHLGRKRRAVVYEIIAGFDKHYIAVGDRVLCQKEDAIVTEITRNGSYTGKTFQQESPFLDRWGYLRTEDMDADSLVQHKEAQAGDAEFDLEAIDKYIEAAASSDEDRVTAASHIVKVKLLSTDEEIVLESAGEVNLMLGGYCLTVHKSQGSEWNKVFFIMHHTHATMNQRELLYTAITRAKKYLHIICEPTTFEKGVMSQKIKGNTLAEKAEWFKGKQDERAKQFAAKQRDLLNDPVTLAFSLVPQYDALAREAVQHWWALAQKMFGERLTKPCPEFGWRIKGSSAGTAYYRTREISCNPAYLHVDANDMIAETIPHEVAHIVANDLFGREGRGHGVNWKMIMQTTFRKNPERCHTMGKLNPILQRLVEESKAAQHEEESEE